MDNNSGGFKYTYSAREREEINKIREKYTERGPEEENKLERLRRLDARPAARARAVSLIFGVVGTLTLGLGMSLVMSNLGELIGTHRDLILPLGIAVGAVGGVLTALAYPIYSAVLKKERGRVAAEILRLSDELMR